MTDGFYYHRRVFDVQRPKCVAAYMGACTVVWRARMCAHVRREKLKGHVTFGDVIVGL